MEKIEYYGDKEFKKLLRQKILMTSEAPGLFTLLAISLFAQILLNNVSSAYWWIVPVILFSDIVIALFLIIQLSVFFNYDNFENSIVLDSIVKINKRLKTTDFLTLFIVMFFNFKIMGITVLSNYSWWVFTAIVCFDILPCFTIANKDLKNYFKDKLNNNKN